MYYTIAFLSIVTSVASTLMPGSMLQYPLMWLSGGFLILAFLILGMQIVSEYKSIKPFPRDAKGRFIKRK